MRVSLRQWVGRFALGCCVLCRAACAQDSLTVPTHATPNEIIQWLYSGDPRMVAWGATFAAKNGAAEMAPKLARLAEEWVPLTMAYQQDGSAPLRTDEEKARAREMACVLDALIQLHGTVSQDAIRRLSVNFGAQALILFAYMPEAERRTFAESIYATRQVATEDWLNWEDREMFQPMPSPLPPRFNESEQPSLTENLIHFAAAILANDPPPGFAASLLSETTMPLHIWVSDHGLQRPISLPAIGNYRLPPQPKGWPEEWTYVVEEKWPEKQGVKAAAAGPGFSGDCPACRPPVETAGEPDAGDKVLIPGIPTLTERRNQSPGSSSLFGGFTSESRLQLLHAMLGDTSRPLGGFLQDAESVTFTDEPAFQAAVQRGIVKREQAFGALARELVAKGLMTQAEAQTAWPTLRLYVVDWRAAKTPPLSEIKLQQQSNKVAVVYFEQVAY